MTSSENRVPPDIVFMQRAYALAARAAVEGEVPVGAVLVLDGEIVGAGYNQPIAGHDPTAHAEILALREAADRLANYRIPGATLYCTLEPCAMCAGALMLARVARVVFATRDPRTGAAGSVFEVLTSDRLNHRILVEHGLMERECAEQLRAFFRARRGHGGNDPTQAPGTPSVLDAQNDGAAGGAGFSMPPDTPSPMAAVSARRPAKP